MQLVNDIETTESLIKIVKKYGFPDIEKLNCEGYAAPFLIFGHSPEKYWKQIGNIIEKERQAGRMVSGDYEYIKWHINGREGSPKSGNEDIQIISN